MLLDHVVFASSSRFPALFLFFTISFFFLKKYTPLLPHPSSPHIPTHCHRFSSFLPFPRTSCTMLCFTLPRIDLVTCLSLWSTFMDRELDRRLECVVQVSNGVKNPGNAHGFRRRSQNSVGSWLKLQSFP